MFETMIFDLDGTLVQTEKLKARSYARAAVRLCPHDLEEDAVIAAFKDVVGLSRKEVATTLMQRFDLAEAAAERQDEFGVASPWQAYVQVRLEIYHEMLSDPETLHQNQWPHNVELLEQARRYCRYVALATMSRCEQTQTVLAALSLADAFDFVATQDDVESGKPDPEIYLLLAQELDVAPDNCLVIEDSPAGVEAALAAGMAVVAVSTPFTQERLHESDLLPARWIVDDPDNLSAVIDKKFNRNEEHKP